MMSAPHAVFHILPEMQDRVRPRLSDSQRSYHLFPLLAQVSSKVPCLVVNDSSHSHPVRVVFSFNGQRLIAFRATMASYSLSTFRLSIPRSSMIFTAICLFGPGSNGSETVPRYASIRVSSISALRLRASRVQPPPSSVIGKKTWRGN